MSLFTSISDKNYTPQERQAQFNNLISNISSINSQELNKNKIELMEMIAFASESSLADLSHALAQNSVLEVKKDNYSYKELQEMVKSPLRGKKGAYYTFKDLFESLNSTKSTQIASRINPLGVSKLNTVLKNALQEINTYELMFIDKIKNLCETNPSYILVNFGKLSLFSEEARFEIAKLIGSKNGGLLPKYIERLGIQDEKKRIELAFLCAQNSAEICEHIGNFKITDQEALFEIAKLINSKTYKLSENIHKFGIQDEQKRLQLALLGMQYYIDYVLKGLNNYQITSPKALSEIAKKCIEINPFSILPYLKIFNITNPQDLLAIAKKCAEREPFLVLPNIKFFNFTDEASRLELAKAYAKSMLNAHFSIPTGTIKGLVNFNLGNESLSEVLKIFVNNNLEETLKQTLEGLEFLPVSPNALFEFAIFCARKDGVTTARLIKNFNITDRDLLKEIAKECVFQAGIKVSPYLKNFEEESPGAENCFASLEEGKFDQSVEDLKEWMGQLFDQKLIKLCDDIAAIHDPKIKKEKLSVLADALYLFDFYLNQEQLEWISKENLLHIIINFPSPHLRFPLCQQLIKLIQKDNYTQAVADLATNKKERDWMKLTRLMLGGLYCEGMQKEIAKKLLSDTAGRTESIFYKGENQKILIEMLIWLIKDEHLMPMEKGYVLQRISAEAEAKLRQRKSKAITQQDIAAEIAGNKLKLVKDLENMLVQIEDITKILPNAQRIFNEFDATKLSGKEKALFQRKRDDLSSVSTVEELKREINDFLKTFANQKNIKSWDRSIKAVRPYTLDEYEAEILENMRLVLSVLQIDPEALKSREKTLPQILESFVTKLPVSQVEGLSHKFIHYFESCLQPIMTYYSQLSTLNDPLVMESFGEYLTAVLNEQFEERRNDISKNHHLETIAESHSELLRVWQIPLPPKEISLSSHKGGSVKMMLYESTDPIDILLIGKCGNTCQWVANNPIYSKGLLGYLMDGKNRFLILKNEDGVVEARCLLRLLWDGEQPVIYMEQIYSKNFSEAEEGFEEQKHALILMAKEKAIAINTILLHTTFDDEAQPYSKPILSLGSSEPYEYCDATQQVEEWGAFTIDESHFV